jgi:PPOX class probable F420-dependent enzyme
VRRIRRDPRARVFPSDPRGKPLGPGVEGTARILEGAEDRDRAEAALDRHYGRTRRIYEKLMAHEDGTAYLEVAAAAPQPDRPAD